MRADKMKEAKIKAARYCAYQERAHQEVRNKLFQIGLYGEEVEHVLTELITEDFVNEERFAKAFASGKFRINNWGRDKIKYVLNQKKISAYCIEQGLKEITEKDYLGTIRILIKNKSKTIAGDDFTIKNKIARYLIGKGFESELVWPVINDELQSRS